MGLRKTHTVETRRRIAMSMRGGRQSKETRDKIARAKMKPVVRLDDGRVFNSIGEAAEALGVSHAAVSMVLRGLRNEVRGHKFAYIKSN